MSYLFPSQTITFEAALRDIASGSPKARAFAAHALGDVSEPVERRRAVDALVRALDDDRPEVRAEACSSLGELGDTSALPHLIKRLDDGVAPVRQNAAIALGSLGQPEAFEPLAEALRSGPVDLRFQAATSLVEIDAPKAFEPVLAAMNDADAQVVGAAALSLGAIGKLEASKKDRAVDALASKLGHLDAGTRFDVAYALAELGDASGLDILAKACADEDRAWDAVSALGEIKAKDALARAASNKKTPSEAKVLAAGTLLGLATAPNADSQDAAAPGAGTLDLTVQAARAVLIEELTNRKTHVRGLVIEHLTGIGGSWALGPLEKLSRSGKGTELLEQIGAALTAIKIRTGGRNE